MSKFKSYITGVTLLMSACNCNHENCKIEELFTKGSCPEEDSWRPWDKPQNTVSGIKKEQVSLKHKFLILDTQTESDKEVILRRKREEEKKSSLLPLL